MTQEEKMISLFNLNELFEKINSLIGVELTWKVKVKENYRKHYLYIESNNIKDMAGIMSRVYKTLHLATFNFSMYTDKNDEYTVWMSVNFQFEYNNGGSNGCDFLDCFLMKDGHWKITIRN